MRLKNMLINDLNLNSRQAWLAKETAMTTPLSKDFLDVKS